MMNVTCLLIWAFLLGCDANAITVGQDQNPYSDEMKPSDVTYFTGKKFLFVFFKTINCNLLCIETYHQWVFPFFIQYISSHVMDFTDYFCCKNPNLPGTSLDAKKRTLHLIFNIFNISEWLDQMEKEMKGMAAG